MTSLVSDETLGKVVRLVWERPILCADRTAIMTHVLEDQWATALDVAREMLTPEDDAIAALEEANEEAAVTYDDREAKLDAVCRTKLYRGEWIAPGAVPGLARAMADTIRATVAAHETQLDAVTADVKAAAPPGIEVERVADGFRLTGQARRVMTAHNPSNPQPPAEWPLPRGASPWLNPDQPPLPRMAWTIAGHTYSTAAGHDAFTELRRKVEAGEWDEPLPDTTRIDATAKHPIPHLDDAPEPPKRQEHDPSRRWACPKCTSVLAVERIFEIVAGRGERYAHVVRCLCGEVRP